MKISTKGRYGLRALADMAIHSNGEHVSLNSIAERQNISDNYLEQVFSILRKAGLVKSVKGAQGGYILAADPADITVGNILRALEGNLSVTDERSEAESVSETGLQRCISKNVWEKINDSVNQVVDSITLEDLVTEYQKASDNMSLMFFI
jgi:Rrf2 family protein